MCEHSEPLSDLNRNFFELDPVPDMSPFPPYRIAKLTRPSAHATSLYEQDWVRTLLAGQARFVTANAEVLGPVPVQEGREVTVIRGMDISSSMVAAFAAPAAEQGFVESKALAVRADLSAAEKTAVLAGPEWHEFDVAVVAMALHHLEDPGNMILELVGRLRRGGRLIVLEWLRHKDEATEFRETSRHVATAYLVNDHVFTEASLRQWFDSAGCREAFVAVVDKEMGHIPEQVVKVPGGVERQLILASGVKA
ncbi:hypothetical protein ACHAQH_005725 [Verticillium albo-atrum]